MDAVSQLERQWPSLAAGPLARVFSEWSERQPSLQRFPGPAALLSFLGEAHGEESDSSLHALLTLAHGDPLAGRLCLQAILPALKSQARRQIHTAAQYEEVWEALLAFAWEAICTYPLSRRRRVGANLVLQVHHDLTRERRRHSALRPIAPSENHRPLPAASDPAGVETFVAHAVCDRVIGEREGELVLLTRVDGVSLGALAQATGDSYAALRKRRARAEAALRRWIVAQRDVPKSRSMVLNSGAETG